MSRIPAEVEQASIGRIRQAITEEGNDQALHELERFIKPEQFKESCTCFSRLHEFDATFLIEYIQPSISLVVHQPFSRLPLLLVTPLMKPLFPTLHLLLATNTCSSCRLSLVIGLLCWMVIATLMLFI